MFTTIVAFITFLLPVWICLSCCWYVGRSFEKYKKLEHEIWLIKYELYERRNKE